MTDLRLLNLQSDRSNNGRVNDAKGEWIGSCEQWELQTLKSENEVDGIQYSEYWYEIGWLKVEWNWTAHHSLVKHFGLTNKLD